MDKKTAISIYDHQQKLWLRLISIRFTRDDQISSIDACRIETVNIFKDGFFTYTGTQLNDLAIKGIINHNLNLFP